MLELKMIQLQDFNSPKKAFYNLFLLQTEEGYQIRKESGASGKVLDCRTWTRYSLHEAEKMFLSIVRRKTNPTRKSQRHYQIITQQAFFKHQMAIAPGHQHMAGFPPI